MHLAGSTSLSRTTAPVPVWRYLRIRDRRGKTCTTSVLHTGATTSPSLRPRQEPPAVRRLRSTPRPHRMGRRRAIPTILPFSENGTYTSVDRSTTVILAPPRVQAHERRRTDVDRV